MTIARLFPKACQSCLVLIWHRLELIWRDYTFCSNLQSGVVLLLAKKQLALNQMAIYLLLCVPVLVAWCPCPVVWRILVGSKSYYTVRPAISCLQQVYVLISTFADVASIFWRSTLAYLQFFWSSSVNFDNVRGCSGKRSERPTNFVFLLFSLACLLMLLRMRLETVQTSRVEDRLWLLTVFINVVDCVQLSILLSNT